MQQTQHLVLSSGDCKHLWQDQPASITAELTRIYIVPEMCTCMRIQYTNIHQHIHIDSHTHRHTHRFRQTHTTDMTPLLNKPPSAPPGSNFSSHLQSERRTVLVHIYCSLERSVLSASRAEIYHSQMCATCLPCLSATRAASQQGPLADVPATVSALTGLDSWHVLAGNVTYHVLFLLG